MTSSLSDHNERPRLWYIYDALCGWCYGFSPVMKRLQESYGNTLNFEVISGGMVTGKRVGAIGEVAPYISWAYKTVEERTGVRFGEGFLQGILADGTAIFTSLPPALALTAFKTFQPQNAVLFAHALQTAVYSDGIEPSNHEAYLPYAVAFGIDAEAFRTAMLAPETLRAAETEFQLSTRLGVTGFPTVFVQRGDTLSMIAQGYTDYAEIQQRLEYALAEATTNTAQA
jgi:putative protein-disulfide isomerase